jgi:hypothetical protein
MDRCKSGQAINGAASDVILWSQDMATQVGGSIKENIPRRLLCSLVIDSGVIKYYRDNLW